MRTTLAYLATAASILVTAGCASSLTPFGDKAPNAAFEGKVKPMLAECMRFRSDQKDGYVQSLWAYCGEIETPDRLWYRKYKDVGPELTKVSYEVLKPILFPGAHKVHELEERSMGGERVQYLHATVVSNNRDSKTIYSAKTSDNHYFFCSVDLEHAYKPADDPRNVAQRACWDVLTGMLAAVR